MQVVIEDDNQIKFERKAELRKPNAEQEYDNSLQNFFEPDNSELALRFESKRFQPLTIQHGEQHANSTEEEFGLPRWSTASHELDNHQPTSINRYSRKIIPPSFSKIPDFVSEQIMASEMQKEVQVPKETTSSADSGKTLVVPVGSRVHTIRYEDYPMPESSQPARQHYADSQYDPNTIIEVPSSRPVLPVVFNFRTKSSPIVAKQTHFKLAQSPPSVQYFETNEPPHIHEHVVHKPIYQDIHEILPIYRVYLREIKPVQEYTQTLVHTNKDYMPAQPAYSPTNYPLYPTHYQAPQLVAPHPPHLDSLSGYNTVQSPPDQVDNSLPQTYAGYSSMVHSNPYMDVSYQIPYRIQDLYKKPLAFEPKYLSMNKFNKFN